MNFVSFCLKNSRQCLGISTGNNKGPEDFLGLQGKGENVSVAQKRWILDSNHHLRPWLFQDAYVTVDSKFFLRVSYNKGTPVNFTADPYFSVNNGSLCVTPMQCQRNALGFCNPNSNKVARFFTHGQYTKLLPCRNSPQWEIIQTPEEYEQHPAFSPTRIVPTTTSVTTIPSGSPSSFSPSLSPSEIFPSTAPTWSPYPVPSFSPELVPTTSPSIRTRTPTFGGTRTFAPVSAAPNFITESQTVAPQPLFSLLILVPILVLMIVYYYFRNKM